MTRAILFGDIPVIPGALISILNDKRYGRAGCSPLKYAGQYLYRICFLSLGYKPALARFAPVQIGLNICLAQKQAGRHTINDTANSLAMAFPKAGKGK